MRSPQRATLRLLQPVSSVAGAGRPSSFVGALIAAQIAPPPPPPAASSQRGASAGLPPDRTNPPRTLKQRLGRGLIVLLGLILVVYSIGWPVLGLVGARASGSISDTRRQGGERNDAVPGRYTWIISYRFTAADGREYTGSTQRIGGFGGPDHRPSGSIRYLPQFPHLNAPQEDTKLSLGTGILLFAGTAMILPDFWMRRRGKKRKR